MGRLFAIIVFCLGGGGLFATLQHVTFGGVYHNVCTLVWREFYENSETLHKWEQQCLNSAKGFWGFTSKKSLVENINLNLADLGASHLWISLPAEVTYQWEGTSEETGIRARWVESEIIITKVYPQSAAEKAGIRVGDVVVSVDGSPLHWPMSLQNIPGRYVVIRGDQTLELEVGQSSISEDDSPRLTPFGDTQGVLTLLSFRPKAVEGQMITSLAEELKNYEHIIVDLRDNAGGNFVTMLQMLSPFFCRPTIIGELVRPRVQSGQVTTMPNVLDDQEQLGLLDRFASVSLRTFASEACYDGPVTVLINNETGSTGEIFAHAMAFRESTRVWGAPSKGDVLVGVWYPLNRLGEGYTITIPVGTYVDASGETLEGRGVIPSRVLYYNKEEMLVGEDSWLLRATEERVISK